VSESHWDVAEVIEKGRVMHRVRVTEASTTQTCPMHQANRIRFNFRAVKLLQITDLSNFRVFIFADAGSQSLIRRFVVSSESLSY